MIDKFLNNYYVISVEHLIIVVIAESNQFRGN